MTTVITVSLTDARDGFTLEAMFEGLSDIDRATRVAASRALDHLANWTALGVEEYIRRITFYDGNYSGVEDPVVDVRGFTLDATYVRWRGGDQMAYVEFGTGAKGAENRVHTAAALEAYNYWPDPTKQFWYYKDRKTAEIKKSHGLAPYAPMERAFRDIPHSNVVRSAMDVVMDLLVSSMREVVY